MIRVEYCETTRLATIDDRVGYDWQSATGKPTVSYGLAIGMNSSHLAWGLFSLAVGILLAKSPHPSHFCSEALCLKGLWYVRGWNNPSHNPHLSLTCLSRFIQMIALWDMMDDVRDMWGKSEGPKASLTCFEPFVQRHSRRFCEGWGMWHYYNPWGRSPWVIASYLVANSPLTRSWPPIFGKLIVRRSQLDFIFNATIHSQIHNSQFIFQGVGCGWIIKPSHREAAGQSLVSMTHGTCPCGSWSPFNIVINYWAHLFLLLIHLSRKIDNNLDKFSF